MNWSIINPHKTKIIAASTVTTMAVGAGALFYGVKPTPKETANPPPPANQTQAAPDTIDLKIKGNRKSKIYHLKGCPNYNDLKESNVVWFKTREEAERAGYRVAKNC